jgi:DNA-binding Lrp family transcriptional regulator
MHNENMENELLFQMQNSFPMTQKPFEVIANELGDTEEHVLTMVQKPKDKKIIRQTSAIFDTRRLGYKSSLVAFRVAEDKVDAAAEIINAYPGVSHNYLRNHDYNIFPAMKIVQGIRTLKPMTQKTYDISVILMTVFLSLLIGLFLQYA